jgi:hypothetical protein
MPETCCAYDGLHCLLGALRRGKGTRGKATAIFLTKKTQCQICPTHGAKFGLPPA